MKKNESLSTDEAVKNLLIVLALQNGADPKLIASVTGIAEKTIRNKFPMKLIKGE